MKTIMKTIPFDIEIAKNIERGDCSGRIVTRYGKDVTIKGWHVNFKNSYVIVGFFEHVGETLCMTYTQQGKAIAESNNNLDLVLQVPEWSKCCEDGDVLVDSDGVIFIYKKGDDMSNDVSCEYYLYLYNDEIRFQKDMIQKYYCHYTDIKRCATEEEKQILINRLEQNPSSEAQRILKRYFGIEKQQEYVFKPFDKVLVRNHDKELWSCNIISSVSQSKFEDYPFRCINGGYKLCIPYNDKTKHLLGTIWDLEEK